MTAEPDNFYAGALEEAERAAMLDASTVAGLVNEIALLRVLLRRTIETDPSDWEAYLEHVKRLVEAVLAQKELGADDSRELSAAVTDLLSQAADALRGYNPEAKPL